MYQSKKGDQLFNELKDLIENYDNGDIVYQKSKLGKLTKKRKRGQTEISLQTVEEKEEENDVTTIRGSTDSLTIEKKKLLDNYNSRCQDYDEEDEIADSHN